MNHLILSALLLLSAVPSLQAHEPASENEMKFVQIATHSKEERTRVANLGISIEFVRSDSVWAFADAEMLKAAKRAGFKVLGVHEASVGRGGHEGVLDFPDRDSLYHNYDELLADLKTLAAAHPELTRLSSAGKSLEGREQWALHINSNLADLESGKSARPGVIFMGAHHAREHLSVEVPLMLAKHLLANKDDPRIKNYLETRDIWIIPLVNPDGAEFDIASGRYKSWRKNRRLNDDGSYGVDLNRNYSYGWGTGGSSDNPRSDIYMGKEAFSEPETQNIRDFVEAHLNARVLLTFHTYSELVLYPWGGKYDPIADARDLKVFETMAQKMASWNKYTPMQASELYIASGDTTDWAYGTHGIFAFTFELSPNSILGGGFYPGEEMIEKAFKANLEPTLYLIDSADDPYKTIDGGSLYERGFAPTAAPLLGRSGLQLN